MLTKRGRVPSGKQKQGQMDVDGESLGDGWTAGAQPMEDAGDLGVSCTVAAAWLVLSCIGRLAVGLCLQVEPSLRLA